MPRTSHLNLGVRVSPHPASDVLTLRFCSCAGKYGNFGGLPLDFLFPSWYGSRHCDVDERVHLTGISAHRLHRYGSVVLRL
ncbi:hypothetical protein I8752_34775 [Nostocaceae cyanobacterium CENA369]|uniref:Uncharacterized protein n=1 Tax=Dendronalium phyllosphericum CENA369 TaxID=1725256 RepID=A0A8J7LGK3_9NOST|nr:hypothetical protein [Dendronalium phyllosphericum CENA369]MBH8578024.1 hypothetical protein [Dendronalium phyllosphericum CENA369]